MGADREGTTSTAGFADRLIQRMRALGHPLCVGLDPYLDRLPRAFRRGTLAPGHARAAGLLVLLRSMRPAVSTR